MLELSLFELWVAGIGLYLLCGFVTMVFVTRKDVPIMDISILVWWPIIATMFILGVLIIHGVEGQIDEVVENDA